MPFHPTVFDDNVTPLTKSRFVQSTENPDKPVPLAMFANVAGSYLWGWTAVGAALELPFQIIPVAVGLRESIDAGLARVFDACLEGDRPSVARLSLALECAEESETLGKAVRAKFILALVG